MTDLRDKELPHLCAVKMLENISFITCAVVRHPKVSALDHVKDMFSAIALIVKENFEINPDRFEDFCKHCITAFIDAYMEGVRPNPLQGMNPCDICPEKEKCDDVHAKGGGNC